MIIKIIFKINYINILNYIMKFCLRCGKNFNDVNNFKRHLNKKNMCKFTYLNITYKDMHESYDEHIKDFEYKYNIITNEYKKNIKELSQNIKEKNNKNEENIELKCNKCNKYYKYNSRLYQHIKKCNLNESNINIDNIRNNSNIINEIDENSEEIKKELKELKKEYNKKIKDLEDKISEKGCNITNNTQNNIQNNNVDVINGNKIIINNFGDEDLSKMKLSDWEKIGDCDFNMIQELIKYKHLDTAENRNIYFSRTRDKYGLILKDGKWIVMEKWNIVDTVVEKNGNYIQNVMKNNKKKIDKRGKINPERVSTVAGLCMTDKEENEKVRNGTMLILLNGKELVKDTYENNYGKKIKE